VSFEAPHERAAVGVKRHREDSVFALQLDVPEALAVVLEFW
jgi:hypothetical protein